MALRQFLRPSQSCNKCYLLERVKGIRTLSTSSLKWSNSDLPKRPVNPQIGTKGNKILETDLSTIDLDRIRNFSIIAHIDHGKSTLADCMLEYVGAIDNRTTENDRVLDKLQVERQRGITVKAQTASVIYKVSEITEFS